MLASGAWVGAVALVAIAIVLIMAETASGQSMNEIIIKLDPFENVVDVEPGNPTNGVLLINGTVRVKNQTAPEIKIDLQTHAGNWENMINPSSFVFRAHEREDRVKRFTITIRAPIGHSSRISQNVVMGGTWQSSGLTGDIDTSSFIIFVRQYYAAAVEVPELHLTDAGGKVSIPVAIWNTGNDLDEFSITIENRRALEKKGWTIESIPTVMIDEKLNEVVRIKVTAPENAGRFTMVVNVTSIGSMAEDSNDTRTVLKTFHVRVDDDRTLEIGLLLIGGVAAVSVAVFWRWRSGSWSYV